MATRIQIGEPIPITGLAEPLTISIEQWADEAPDTVIVDGFACTLYLDPGTMAGRTQIEALRQRLADALAEHDKAIERIYSGLEVGGYCSNIRLPRDGELRCPHTASDAGLPGMGCSRVQHADGHHVAVDDSYQVIAVRRRKAGEIRCFTARCAESAAYRVSWVKFPDSYHCASCVERIDVQCNEAVSSCVHQEYVSPRFAWTSAELDGSVPRREIEMPWTVDDVTP